MRVFPILATVLSFLLLLTACDAFTIEERPDPNGPSLEGVVGDLTRDKVANLAAGVESGMRTDINLYLTDVGVIGREYYRFSASDPRFSSELLGQGQARINNNSFYITRPWAERYRVVRTGNTLLAPLESVPEGVLSANEKAATRGVINTFIGYQLLLNLNLTYLNGIRVDVSGDEVGPFVDYDTALQAILDLLNEANDDLGSAGQTVLPFPLSSGFEDFTAEAQGTPIDSEASNPYTAESFAFFNRGIAARVALYQKDYDRALDLLDDSFIDVGRPLTFGARHVFSTNAGDLTNPFFIDPQATGEVTAAHPSYVNDIRSEDDRINKVVLRNDPFNAGGLSSAYGFAVYENGTAPIPIIRNAELLLIRAEANLLKSSPDLQAVRDDLSVIRQAAGLGSASSVADDELFDELLYQRRYELYGEGHRWIDVRRLLGDDCTQSNADTCLNDVLPVDESTSENAWLQFPIPATEQN
jgi:hypothetical protein